MILCPLAEAGSCPHFPARLWVLVQPGTFRCTFLSGHLASREKEDWGGGKWGFLFTSPSHLSPEAVPLSAKSQHFITVSTVMSYFFHLSYMFLFKFKAFIKISVDLDSLHGLMPK